MLFKNCECKIQFSSLTRFMPKILLPNLTNSVKKKTTKFSNDINKKRTQTKKFQTVKTSYYGRSMIEMLGVLAIIAVLSVGGIAGYSKAMEKFKLNKMVQQYNEMLFGVMQNLDDFKAPLEWSSTKIIKALNIAPPSWTVYKTTNTNSMKDDFGNIVTWFPESGRTLRITFDLNGTTKIQQKMCTEIASNVFMPLRSVLGMIYIEGGLYFYGDTYCSNNLKPYERCINELSIRGINSICTSCVKRNRCFMQLYFYH